MVAAKQFYNHADYTAADSVFNRIITEYAGTPRWRRPTPSSWKASSPSGSSPPPSRTAKAIPVPGSVRRGPGQGARHAQFQSVYAAAQDLQKGEDHVAAAPRVQTCGAGGARCRARRRLPVRRGRRVQEGRRIAEAAKTYLYLADTYHDSEYADRAVSLAAFLYSLGPAGPRRRDFRAAGHGLSRQRARRARPSSTPRTPTSRRRTGPAPSA